MAIGQQELIERICDFCTFFGDPKLEGVNNKRCP